MLDDELAGLLKERVPLVFTWAVNTPEMYRQVARWNIDGVITDNRSAIPAQPPPAEARVIQQIFG